MLILGSPCPTGQKTKQGVLEIPETGPPQFLKIMESSLTDIIDKFCRFFHTISKSHNELYVLKLGKEGRAGMAVVCLEENMEFDGAGIYKHVTACLASYACPIFLRYVFVYL